jgi:hypothetical protein
LARLLILTAIAAAAAAFAGPSAFAAAPVIQQISVQARHPAVSFTAPQADSVSIYFATKPDRATDGSFLQENIASSDFFTDDEIQAGHWLDDTQLDPGTYYVLLNASPDFDSCYVIANGDYDPACANGYSNLATLVVPRPAVHYSVAVTSFKFLKQLDLRLTASPLGVDTPYKVCYLTKAKARRCVVGKLDGFGWNSPADDTLDISTRNLARTTLFTWFVAGHAVANRVVKS